MTGHETDDQRTPTSSIGNNPMNTTSQPDIALANLISSVQLFADIPSSLLGDIVASASLYEGDPGENLPIDQDNYIGLIEGEIQILCGDDRRPIAAMKKSPSSQQDITLIYAPNGSDLRFDRRSRVIVLNGNRIDDALSHTAVLNEVSDRSPTIRKRLLWLTQIPAFSALAPGQLIECAEAMSAQNCEEGCEVITQGQTGEYFYVVESGELEVWREDPLEDDPASCVATLARGDAFGEEALLQDGLRNATVRARKNSQLLRLDRDSFDKYLRASLLQEIDARTALDLLENEATLLDCRYEMEYEISRIPGANLIPLDKIRQQINELDPKRQHVVYCRTGRRSKAAAYLLAQHGIKAVSVKGGINEWPFEIEGDTDGH